MPQLLQHSVGVQLSVPDDVGSMVRFLVREQLLLELNLHEVCVVPHQLCDL